MPASRFRSPSSTGRRVELLLLCPLVALATLALLEIQHAFAVEATLQQAATKALNACESNESPADSVHRILRGSLRLPAAHIEVTSTPTQVTIRVPYRAVGRMLAPFFGSATLTATAG